MQYDINIAQARQEAEELKRISGNLNLRLLAVSGLYVSLRLVGDPAIQGVVKHILKQCAALTTESLRVASMANALNTIATTYYNADAQVVKSFSINGSIIDAFGADRRHSASNEQMDELISEYEREHPEDARNLDNLLASGKNNNLTEDDIRKIKYLAYTAEEPYRTIYLKYITGYLIGDASMKEGAYYQPGSKTINFTYPDCFGRDPRGEYTTFFHESGHGIDDLADLVNKNGSDTITYKTHSDEMGKDVTVLEAIEYDVYYNENNPHSVTSLAEDIIMKGGTGSKGNIDNVIEAFKNGSPNGLSKEDRQLYIAVRNAHLNEMSQHQSAHVEAVTDVYGGISKNGLQTDGNGRHGYTHEDSYWNDQNYNSLELWAEYFSYNMAGDTEALNNLREYFPEASKVLDEYARSLAEA